MSQYENILNMIVEAYANGRMVTIHGDGACVHGDVLDICKNSVTLAYETVEGVQEFTFKFEEIESITV